mmetsp:Transcript_22986/g.47349  ORF Transcript_22986/g.47349 Transcript_22986/m.47349 type:complete len:767 (+) Transcript_22986:65-2365(+)
MMTKTPATSPVKRSQRVATDSDSTISAAAYPNRNYQNNGVLDEVSESERYDRNRRPESSIIVAPHCCDSRNDDDIQTRSLLNGNDSTAQHDRGGEDSKHLTSCRLFKSTTSSLSRDRVVVFVSAFFLLVLLTCYVSLGGDREDFFSKLKLMSSRQRIKRYHTGTYIPGKKIKKHFQIPAFPAGELLGIPTKKVSSPAISSASNPLSSLDIAQADPPYDASTDFEYKDENDKVRTLVYWDEIAAAIEQTESLLYDDQIDDIEKYKLPQNETLSSLWSNFSTWGPCYPRAVEAEASPNNRHLRWSSKKNSNNSNWTYIVQSNSDRITDESSIIYPSYRETYHSPSKQELGGLCRPGFLIIGQGKCGTSSLYHYLTGHPRVLPANEKQIHYFLYHRTRSLGWYYSHFPSLESFLGRGALMTGEASPGYMPYPSVVEMVAKTMGQSSIGGEESSKGGIAIWKDRVQSMPKIIAIVRDPIDRAVSSYKYNYIQPALNKLKAGTGVMASGDKIPGGMSDEFYLKHHLFTFEELAYSELKVLKSCLEPGGEGEKWTYRKYGKKSSMFFHQSFETRKKSSQLSPLIHLDGACYNATKSKPVPRAQWVDLAKENPKKVLLLPNLQLTQSIIGRGLYALPLEWWYEVFSSSSPKKLNEDRIFVVCTEHMSTNAEVTMENVTQFLGLPNFDFSNVTGAGRYNVGSHRGYDTVTPGEDSNVDDDDSEEEGRRMNLDYSQTESELASISDDLMLELLDFYRPYNERLFKLIGKACPWKN